jgi:N,N-dimethylglycine/sarcosine dehydrogenase ferredoxin subunit
MLDYLLPSLLILAILLLLIGAIRRARLWCQGQREAVNIVQGLLAMPRRYLVDLHHVVERDKYMSRTHVATAGGFVASFIFIVLVYLFGLSHPFFIWSLLACTVVMFVGAVFVFLRRCQAPARLSKGPWMRLPKSLLVFAASFFIFTLPQTGVVPANAGGWVLVALLLVGVSVGLVEMLLGMGWGGPMKHAFAGALHLAFHRRSERFGGGQSTGLKLADLQAKTIGVATPSDFKWNQLLGFDACVQCGRCEAVCPAFAAGQPLNPKKLIQDMVVGMTGGTDAKYAGSAYPGKTFPNKTFPDKRGGTVRGGPNEIITEGLLAPETLWSCTTCRACVEECPMMIEHVDAIVDMRRFVTMERGKTPNKGAEILDNLIATDNPSGIDPGHRTHWAADQNLPLMADVKQTDVLFWVSDGAFDMRSQRILRAMVTLMKSAQIDFAVLGDEELDCGDLARRLGDDATFQQLAVRNIAVLNQYRFNRIVTTDPHAFHCLKNEYPDLGGRFDVLHHSQFINELVQQKKLNIGSYHGASVTYHDPCYLGRYNGEYDAPRQLLTALGVTLVEMQRSGFRSRCCGGGGGAPITDIPGERRIADMRMEDIIATGAEQVAVACQQCTAMLEGVVEPRPSVKDIAEMVVEILVEEAL